MNSLFPVILLKLRDDGITPNSLSFMSQHKDKPHVDKKAVAQHTHVMDFWTWFYLFLAQCFDTNYMC